MQIAPEPSALLFARQHQTLARALQLGCQGDGVDGHTGLVREIVEQAPVGCRERLARHALAQ